MEPGPSGLSLTPRSAALAISLDSGMPASRAALLIALASARRRNRRRGAGPLLLLPWETSRRLPWCATRARLVRKPSSLIRKAILVSRNKLLVSGFTCSLKQASGNSGEGRGQPGAGPDLCGSAPLAEEAAP